MFSVLLCVCLALPAPTVENIPQLIAQLAHDDFDVREASKESLAKLADVSEEVRKQVVKALQECERTHPDIEARRGAATIWERLRSERVASVLERTDQRYGWRYPQVDMMWWSWRTEQLEAHEPFYRALKNEYEQVWPAISAFICKHQDDVKAGVAQPITRLGKPIDFTDCFLQYREAYRVWLSNTIYMHDLSYEEAVRLTDGVWINENVWWINLERYYTTYFNDGYPEGEGQLPAACFAPPVPEWYKQLVWNVYDPCRRFKAKLQFQILKNLPYCFRPFRQGQ